MLRFKIMSSHLHAESQHVVSWAVGKTFDQPIDASTVSEVVADGNELRIILNRCENIPVAKDGATGKKMDRQHWFGDHARFIVANILPIRSATVDVATQAHAKPCTAVSAVVDANPPS